MAERGPVSRLATRPARAVARGVVGARTRRWAPYTHLFVLGDGGGWSLDEDAGHLAGTARRLGHPVAPPSWSRFCGRQAVFHTSHFTATHPRWLETTHRLGTAWFHGRPGTPGHPAFDTAFEALRRHVHLFRAVQVTHAEMHELVVAAGVKPERVFRIPIGIDIEHFPCADAGARARAREELGLPGSAFVVGSFQKDGVGWGAGLEPKLVKGPDVLVAVLAALRRDAPELQVLLTGPARGYVRSELERLGIPHRHLLAGSRPELARAYHALDAYVVTSRQEGGPKSVLEALATGAPLVSTRVGQAQEIVTDGADGLLADIDDVEALTAAAARIRDDPELAAALRERGRRTAELYAYELLDSRWAPLLAGLLEPETRRAG